MTFKIYRAKEEELIQGCLRKDRTAQKQVFDLFASPMLGLCKRYIKNQAEAEDTLICAFTKIFEKIHQFKHEGSFEGWIRRIVINEALTRLRKNRMMYVETELADAVHEPDYDSADNLAVEDIMNMVRALPDGYRIVFNMYAIDGYNHKEIADHLGISENTSKSQLSRARNYLKRLLLEEQTFWSNHKSHDHTAG